MLNDLIKVARRLDSFGLTKEANSLRAIIKSAGEKEDWQELLSTTDDGVDTTFAAEFERERDKNELNLHNELEQSLSDNEQSYPRFTRTQRETTQNGERALELLESMSAEEREKLLMDHPDAMWKLFGIRAKLNVKI
jgi:hypothetical protein